MLTPLFFSSVTPPQIRLRAVLFHFKNTCIKIELSGINNENVQEVSIISCEKTLYDMTIIICILISKIQEEMLNFKENGLLIV